MFKNNMITKKYDKVVGEQGFTLIELLISSAVFSVILLLCTYGLIQIGNTFYKGRTVTNTQNAARSVMDNVSQAIQYGGRDVRPSPQVVDTNTKDKGAFCTGKVRYRYQKNQVKDTASAWGLIVDDQGATCNEDANKGNAKELLGQNMRITELVIRQVGDNYTINLSIAYGDDDLLDANNKCKVGAGNQFCATATLSTTVQRRIQ